MSGDRPLAIILGVVICATAFALMSVIFWMLWRRKESTGSFYKPARNSAMYMDAPSLVGSCENSPDPALVSLSRLWKEQRTSYSQAPARAQRTHSCNTSFQTDQRPDMSAYPLGKRTVDQRRGIEITDPSGFIQPHELEAGIPLESDAQSPVQRAVPWISRVLGSETNSPSAMREASLRTRRATKSGRDSGFVAPKLSSLGMRRLGRAEVNAELAAGGASSPGRLSGDTPSVKVSPMTTASPKLGCKAYRPSRDFHSPTHISNTSSELDPKFPMRRASFSSWRRSTFDVIATSAPDSPTPCRASESDPQEETARRPSEMSGEAIMRRSSIWIERESFPPRNCRSLEMPRNTYRPHGRPLVVMNSPTESSLVSEDSDDDYEADNTNAFYTLPALNLYYPASTFREDCILQLPFPESLTKDTPATPPPPSHHQKVPSLLSPLPYLKDQTKQQQPSGKDLLAPTARKDSSTVQYSSWSEIQGFEFMRKASPEADDGGDGWRPVPDSVA